MSARHQFPAVLPAICFLICFHALAACRKSDPPLETWDDAVRLAGKKGCDSFSINTKADKGWVKPFSLGVFEHEGEYILVPYLAMRTEAGVFTKCVGKIKRLPMAEARSRYDASLKVEWEYSEISSEGGMMPLDLNNAREVPAQ
jgi:hypothetical protein